VGPAPAIYSTFRFLSARCNQIGAALLAQELSGLALTAGELGVLFLVATLSPVDQTTLGRALRLDKSRVSLVLSDLQARGAIRRKINPSQKRQMVVTITPAGSHLANQALPRGARADERVFEGARAGARERLVSLLTTVVSSHSGFEKQG
jgi:DNA-binding MarR family transcriptional regulator